MNKKSALVIIMLFLFLTEISGGWTENLKDYFADTAPSVGMSFLKIGIGARAISLGGAYSSIVKDATAVFWNPGGVIYTEGLDASFSHLSLMEGVRYESVAISTGDGNQGFGIGMGGVFYGNMELRDESPSEEPMGTFNAYSFVAKASYGHRLGNDIVAGVSVGAILEKIYVYSTHTYTIDFALRYSPFIIKPIIFSLHLNNLGPKVQYVDETFRLPLTTKLGCSYSARRFNTDLTVITEIVKSLDTSLSGATGLELGFSHISLRFGYNYGDKNAGRWAGGLGVKYNFLSIDYSFAPYLMDLGAKQCVSLNLDF